MDPPENPPSQEHDIYEGSMDAIIFANKNINDKAGHDGTTVETTEDGEDYDGVGDDDINDNEDKDFDDEGDHNGIREEHSWNVYLHSKDAMYMAGRIYKHDQHDKFPTNREMSDNSYIIIFHFIMTQNF